MRRHGICGCYASKQRILQGDILGKREDGVQDRLVETPWSKLEEDPRGEILRQRSFVCQGLGENLTIPYSWHEDGPKAMEEWPGVESAYQVRRIGGSEQDAWTVAADLREVGLERPFIRDFEDSRKVCAGVHADDRALLSVGQRTRDEVVVGGRAQDNVRQRRRQT